MSDIERDVQSCPHGTSRWVLVLQSLTAAMFVSDLTVRDIDTKSLTILQVLGIERGKEGMEDDVAGAVCRRGH